MSSQKAVFAKFSEQRKEARRVDVGVGRLYVDILPPVGTRDPTYPASWHSQRILNTQVLLSGHLRTIKKGA
jgi:hypothetical protein